MPAFKVSQLMHKTYRRYIANFYRHFAGVLSAGQYDLPQYLLIIFRYYFIACIRGFVIFTNFFPYIFQYKINLTSDQTKAKNLKKIYIKSRKSEKVYCVLKEVLF